MKKKNVLKWIILAIAIAINAFIIVNAFLNGETSAKESNKIAQAAADIINDVKPETITSNNFDKFAFNTRKLVGHFGLFALSGGFSTWTFYLFLKDTKVKYFVYILCFTFAFGFLIATASEFAQTFVAGRSGNWSDVGIDMAGYFLGVLLVFLILFIKKSNIFKRKERVEK